MNTTLKVLLAAKLVLLGALGFAAYKLDGIKRLQTWLQQNDRLKGASQQNVSASAPVAGVLPILPDGPISVSDAQDIRAQLEIIRQDAENKLKQLQIAQDAYIQAKADVEEKLKRIEQEKKFLEETLQKEKAVKEERLKEALEFVAKMEPRKAAPMIENMERDLVVALFRKLPPKTVTKILESMTPAKATELMEYYTHIRSGREYELMKMLGYCSPSAEADSSENGDKKEKN